MYINLFHSYKLRNEKLEREMKKTIQFTILSKRIRYLGIKLPQEAKVLYSENSETLMKEIKDDTNRKLHCRSPAHWILGFPREDGIGD